MSYIKDKTIIDFLCEVEKLYHGDLKFDLPYYFILGHTFDSRLNDPKKLNTIVEQFYIIHQYEEYQAITETQKRKLFLDILINPECDLEQKIYSITSDDMEESKEGDLGAGSKEHRMRCAELYEKSESLLIEHIAFTEEESRLQALDVTMWGFFCAHLSGKADTKEIFEKFLAIRQSQVSGLLNYNQKMRLFIKLYNDWNLDLNASFNKIIENPSLGSKPLASLVVPEDQLSKLMAEQLNLEEKIELEKARAEQEQKDNEGVMCNICLLDLYDKDEDVYIMDLCTHCFHESCLTEYLHNQVKESKFPVKCADENCKIEFTTSDLKDLMTEETLEKYHNQVLDDFLMKNGKDISYCPTANCPYVYFRNPDEDQFSCPVCINKYCLKCKTEGHEGDCLNVGIEKFTEIAHSMNYRACPNCSFWIEKTYGCDHMTCRCGAEFCYKCGKNWKHQLIDGCAFEDRYDRSYYESLLLKERIFPSYSAMDSQVQNVQPGVQ